ELAPVDLELVARRGLEAHGQLLEASPLGAERTDEVLDERDLTRVAALTQLAKKHGRMDLGLLLDSLRQVVLVRLQNARPLRSRRVVRRLLVAKIAPHGVAADSELFGDAANRSPLAMHGFDVHPGLQCEHPGLRLRGREKGPGSSYIRGRVVASAASRLRPDSPASWGGSVFNRRRRVNFQPAMTRCDHGRPRSRSCVSRRRRPNRPRWTLPSSACPGARDTRFSSCSATLDTCGSASTRSRICAPSLRAWRRRSASSAACPRNSSSTR